MAALSRVLVQRFEASCTHVSLSSKDTKKYGPFIFVAQHNLLTALQYSKKGLPFVLPNITTGPEVIIPMSQMDWLLQQPDHVLDQNEVNRSFLQADYTMLHPKVVTDTVHLDVIRKEMTRLLGDYTADVIDEIDFAFRKNWGVDTKQWTEVNSYYTMLDIIGRISNRVIVGFPLCKLPSK
jgi:hypothetical protein